MVKYKKSIIQTLYVNNKIFYLVLNNVNSLKIILEIYLNIYRITNFILIFFYNIYINCRNNFFYFINLKTKCTVQLHALNNSIVNNNNKNNKNY